MADSANSPGVKRKLEGDAPAPPVTKKQKKKPKPRKQLPGEDIDDEHGLNLEIGRMDSQELTDYVIARTKQFQPNISEVELNDQRIPGKTSPDMGHQGTNNLPTRSTSRVRYIRLVEASESQ